MPRISPFALPATLAAALLAPGPAGAQSRLWRANLADAGDFLPVLPRHSPDTSLIRGPGTGGPSGLFELSSEAGWNGVLRREDGSRTEILSAQGVQTLWARPGGGAALGVLHTGLLERNRHLEASRLEARLRTGREAFGLAWMQGLLPPRGGKSGKVRGDAFLDAAVLVPDRRRQGFAWMLAGGRLGIWRLEYGVTQEEIAEDASVLNLDTLGNRERVDGVYRARSLAHRLVVEAPAAGGTVSALAAYAWGRPRRPDGEFWFCDSSRSLHGRLAYGHRGGDGRGLSGLPGGGRAWADFREGETNSAGRRIPPGSEGLKRFHFARNHAVLWEAGLEAGPGAEARDPGTGRDRDPPPRGWRLGGLYRRLTWNSRPPEDALFSRRETLSYNRLGLSFIANLYGGLYKMSELVEGRVRADLAELDGSGSWRLGPFAGRAGLSLYRTGFQVRAAGVSLTQSLLATDTSDTFRTEYRGYLLGATPRLRIGLELGPLSLEAEAAQALPLVVEIREPGTAAGEGIGGEDGARYAPFRNGFAARARLVAGF